MLISPPFLPPPQANEAAFLDASMPECTDASHGTRGAPQGSFPLVSKLTWHNGMHLDAPCDAQKQRLPVRAIADGTVIYRRDSAPHSDDPKHPLNYNPYGEHAAWTDIGLVIVRHTTDIGATGDTPTQITFYSVYMHLARIEAAVRPGKPIWRKDAIGTAGRLFGQEGRLHFEICLDARNLQQLLGPARPMRWTDPGAPPKDNGRTDAVFGSIYVYLPAGTPVRTSAPKSHLYEKPTAGASAATDHFVPDTLHEAQWVEIRYGASGSAAQGGDATLTSYRATAGAGGLLVGQRIGQPHVEKDFEYDMYKEANRRHNDLSAADQARSSPSGWYELLRFGRNLGPDPLPANAAHWRPIPTDSGHVWADLNAPGTYKFSDADFPAFRGWQCFDDDTNPLDQRCDSVELKRLIRDPAQRETLKDRDALAKRLNVPEVRAKLEYAICRFPTEWDKATITQRYEWLKTDEEFRMSEGQGWEEFAAHCEALGCDDLPQEYKEAQWHLHPKRLISHARGGHWLGATEMRRIYSRIKSQNLAMYLIPLNLTLRKYGIISPLRLTLFLGQGAVESQELNLIVEGGQTKGSYQPESSHWFDDSNEHYFDQYIRKNGNKDSRDHIKFRGRGLKQLTGRFNYAYYWVFRGWISLSSFDDPWWLPHGKPRAPEITNPQFVASDPLTSMDAGGWYWTVSPHRGMGAKRQGRDRSTINCLENSSYSSTLVEKVTLAINGGILALDRRQNYSDSIYKFFNDMP
ncbi:MAG: M23 family metallopeptidase [Pseudacidovorax sp.]|uniref:hypothetical protein n=1 Tax=Pseudacidovorax sp. TaxID=1934311 RepID=UPI001B5D71D0|nr:hypothetical protein [Pseudacidovorax sp.]MBP6898268.1 M23 family metallopeptidase [Pseudacidovorax sp.]